MMAMMADNDDKFLPKYQQGENDCGYWSLRIASEITLGKPMTKAQGKKFKSYLSLCAKQGVNLFLSTVQFNKYFSEMHIYFNMKECYGIGKHEEYITTDDVKACLKLNKVVVCNIQNIDFHKNTLIKAEGKGQSGHSICIYGSSENALICRDSNVYRRSNDKTISIALLDEGHAKVKNAKTLELRLKAMRTETHITEMFVVDTEPLEPPVVRRRSKRHKPIGERHTKKK